MGCDARRIVRGTRLALLGIATAASTVSAQAADSVPRGYRSPRRAAEWALLPGGGHFYTGQTAVGVAILSGTVGSIALGMVKSRQRCVTQRFPDPANDSLTVADRQCESADGWRLWGAMIGIGFWFVGIVDAPDSARRANQERGLAIGRRLRAEPLVVAGGPALGVALTWDRSLPR